MKQQLNFNCSVQGKGQKSALGVIRGYCTYFPHVWLLFEATVWPSSFDFSWQTPTVSQISFCVCHLFSFLISKPKCFNMSDLRLARSASAISQTVSLVDASCSVRYSNVSSALLYCSYKKFDFWTRRWNRHMSTMTQRHYSLSDTAKLTVLLQNGPQYLTHKPVPLVDMLQPSWTFLCFGIFKTSFFLFVISSVNLYEVLWIFSLNPNSGPNSHLSSVRFWSFKDLWVIIGSIWSQDSDRKWRPVAKTVYLSDSPKSLLKTPYPDSFFLKVWLYETSSRLHSAEELCYLRNKYLETGPSGENV